MINFDEPVEEQKESDGVQDHSVQSLGAHLSATFQEYKDARRETENEWLRDLRQYNGQYEPDVLARLNDAGARSKVFVGLTRTKVMAAYSRIIDLLFQHGDQFFNIEATPVPDLDPMAVMQMKQLATQQIMDASQMVPSTVPLLPTIQEEGGSSAHRRQMQLTIIAARHSITAVDITLDECTVNDVAAGLP